MPSLLAWPYILSSNDSRLDIASVYAISTVLLVYASFLYAHKINDLWKIDLDKPEAWGFASMAMQLSCALRC